MTFEQPAEKVVPLSVPPKPPKGCQHLSLPAPNEQQIPLNTLIRCADCGRWLRHADIYAGGWSALSKWVPVRWFNFLSNRRIKEFRRVPPVAENDPAIHEAIIFAITSDENNENPDSKRACDFSGSGIHSCGPTADPATAIVVHTGNQDDRLRAWNDGYATAMDQIVSTDSPAEEVVPLRLAEHLAFEGLTLSRCELIAFPGETDATDHPAYRGRCLGEAVAVKWEDNFADEVCVRHAQTAEDRGAVVVRPRRHDGRRPTSTPLVSTPDENNPAAVEDSCSCGPGRGCTNPTCSGTPFPDTAVHKNEKHVGCTACSATYGSGPCAVHECDIDAKEGDIE